MRRNPGILLAIILITALITVLLAGCTGTKLAESFDKDEVISTAEEIIGFMSNEDYEAITSKVREDLRKDLSPDVLKNAADVVLKGAGEFKEFQKSSVVGQKSKSTGEDYAIAILITEYENKKVTYTISFNTNMEVVGFYLR
ncbi:MAG TPA: DUF3887 domain-containing protein [Clostridiaceae bacterium]|nr:DUF3887 domain-containing protein [Clostridiaceae bacterium]